MDKFSHKKSFGQNFLTNDKIAKHIVEAADIVSKDTIIEIGPGQGILTKKLIKSPAKKVIAIEADRQLEDFLNFKDKKFSLIFANAIHKLPEIIADSPISIISNLPYNITSPIINIILTGMNPLPEKAILMVQKEVAERLTSKSGDKNRGILSVITQLICTVRILFGVDRANFMPEPHVDSAVVELSDIRKPDMDMNLLGKILKWSFAGKRKKLKNTLLKTLNLTNQEQNIMHQTKIDFNLRPEDLSVDEWKKLTEYLQDITL